MIEPIADADSSRSAARRWLGPSTWFVLLLIALACYRSSLIDKGHFYWGDERCYLPASDLLDSVLRGDYRAAAFHLYDGRSGTPPARPGFVLLSLLPVLAQRVVGELAGILSNTSPYYDVASAFNVVVTLGVTVCLYSLGMIWTERRWFALLTAALYSLLCNANVWIRHMVPYQESLLFFLLALWLLSSRRHPDERGFGRVVAAGLLTAFAYSCYPGHYAFVIINAVVAVVQSRWRIRSALAFGMSGVAVGGVFEVVARYGDRSYFSDLRKLSGSVTMGSPGEGYVFMWRYLRDVEGTIGILLFLLFCGFVAFVLWRKRVPVPRSARVAMAVAIACYLLHASMAALAEKTVFYGRILAMYLPFLVAGAVLALMQIRRRVLRTAAACCLLAASAYSFAGFAQRYSQVMYPLEFLQGTMAGLGRNISYPANVLWGLLGGNARETIEWFDSDLVMVADTRPEGSGQYVWLASHEQAGSRDVRFIGVNLKFMWYFGERYDRFTPPPGFRLVAEALHPEVFPVTGYEGRRPWERRRVRERQYTMRLYERVRTRERVTSTSVP